MAIDWSHLPKEVINQICMCIGSTDKGFKHDVESDYWVHAKCGKPTVLVAVQECDNCGKTFVPKYHKKIETSFLGIECDDCDPPRRPQ